MLNIFHTSIYWLPIVY